MKLRGLLIIILIGIVAPLSLITVLSESNTNSETIAIIGTGNVCLLYTSPSPRD